jgi:hypothetical protein
LLTVFWGSPQYGQLWAIFSILFKTIRAAAAREVTPVNLPVLQALTSNRMCENEDMWGKRVVSGTTKKPQALVSLQASGPLDLN